MEQQPADPPRFRGAAAAAAPPGSAEQQLVLHPLAPNAAAHQDAQLSSGVKRFVRQQVPDDILNDAALNQAMKALPSNYNFEVHKTVWRLKTAGARTVALQFPEGLLMYACTLADIMEHFAGVEHCIIMGDVTYGACCIDDFSARAMGADFLVHYGHSCLVPVDVTSLPCLYVFVDIAVDVAHLVGSVRLTFAPGTNLVLAGTIQFSSGIQQARAALSQDYPSVYVPKCKPLSPGEVLGCTAPTITTGADAIVFVADGRFHLEAIMIANPSIPAYRYDPYGRVLTREQYDHQGMRAARRKAVEAARPAQHWGVVLGTLGRQGNPALVRRLVEALEGRGRSTSLFLVSELSPTRLALVQGVDAWVQVACPRLSIDWGEAFQQPTLTPYEALVCLGLAPAFWHDGHDSGQQRQERATPASQQQEQLPASHTQPQQLQQEAAAGGCGGGGTAASGACGQPGCCQVGESEGSLQQGAQKGGDGQPEWMSLPYPMDYYAKEGGEWNSSYHKAAGAAVRQVTGMVPAPLAGRAAAG